MLYYPGTAASQDLGMLAPRFKSTQDLNLRTAMWLPALGISRLLPVLPQLGLHVDLKTFLIAREHEREKTNPQTGYSHTAILLNYISPSCQNMRHTHTYAWTFFKLRGAEFSSQPCGSGTLHTQRYL